jgi:hypothetical protein
MEAGISKEALEECYTVGEPYVRRVFARLSGGPRE